MQPKDFDVWNEWKKKLHASERYVLFHEREIWWCSLGLNIGFEQDGTNDLFERPVLIVKKFNRDVLWVLPLTRSGKKNRYYVPITVGDANSAVILSQLRLISSRRLQRYMHKLPKGQFKRIVQFVQQFFPQP
ncbi:MAG: type II toxin-antitoxin system PemK/MazF family toxin [bacterium]|nr:type II toxin-antitoxin system PemK/MazF family toxin [bacterium]